MPSLHLEQGRGGGVGTLWAWPPEHRFPTYFFFLGKISCFASVIVRCYTTVYLTKSKREQDKEALKYILKLNLAEEGAMHCHWQCWQRMLRNYPKLSHGSCYHRGCQKLATTNFCWGGHLARLTFWLHTIQQQEICRTPKLVKRWSGTTPGLGLWGKRWDWPYPTLSMAVILWEHSQALWRFKWLEK
jgi:hypothetical protein